MTTRLSEADLRYQPCGCGCGERTSNRRAEFIIGHRPKADPVQRFWAKVEKSDDCWPWIGSRGADGYGRFWDGKSFVLAHRFVLRLVGREPASDLQVDHLCRVRECVRPDHLDAVTRLVNVRRALPYREQKTHCKRGHDFAVTGFVNHAGYRECDTCRKELRRARAH